MTDGDQVDDGLFIEDYLKALSAVPFRDRKFFASSGRLAACFSLTCKTASQSPGRIGAAKVDRIAFGRLRQSIQVETRDLQRQFWTS